MKKIFLGILLVLFTACTSEDEVLSQEIIEGPEGTGDFEFKYFENSTLEIVSNDDTYQNWANIQAGENLVFQYQFDFEDEPMIADDEYSETIRFEVDADLTNFTYQTEDLSGLKSTLTKYCFCYFPIDTEKNVDPTGLITGEKISENEWKVTVDVVFYGNEKRTFTSVFTKGSSD